MIIDASVAIDAVADAGPRGDAARRALTDHPEAEPLLAPGHFAVEVMSGLGAAAGRPQHPLTTDGVAAALDDIRAYEVTIDPTTWDDVARAWELAATSLRYADGVYIAAAERHHLALLTADARLARSRAPIRCEVVTVRPDG